VWRALPHLATLPTVELPGSARCADCIDTLRMVLVAPRDPRPHSVRRGRRRAQRRTPSSRRTGGPRLRCGRGGARYATSRKSYPKDGLIAAAAAGGSIATAVSPEVCHDALGACGAVTVATGVRAARQRGEAPAAQRAGSRRSSAPDRDFASSSRSTRPARRAGRWVSTARLLMRWAQVLVRATCGRRHRRAGGR